MQGVHAVIGAACGQALHVCIALHSRQGIRPLAHPVSHLTTLQVKHDDLREGAARLVEQLEGCAAFIADQAPGHRDSVQASAKSLVDEAILLEESLKVGGEWEGGGGGRVRMGVIGGQIVRQGVHTCSRQ